MKKFKKVALLVATAAMVLGATMTVFAGSDETRLNIGSKGYADCYVYVSDGYASAETATYANSYEDYVYASADVQLHCVYASGRDSEVSYDDYEVAVGTSAYAIAEVASGGSSVVSYYATSNHEAAIGNSPTVSAGLYTE